MYVNSNICFKQILNWPKFESIPSEKNRIKGIEQKWVNVHKTIQMYASCPVRLYPFETKLYAKTVYENIHKFSVDEISIGQQNL